MNFDVGDERAKERKREREGEKIQAVNLAAYRAGTALTGLIEFFGFASNSIWNLREITIKNGLGHIQLYQKGYHQATLPDRIQYNIQNYHELHSLISQETFLQKHILGISGELSFAGLVAGHGKSTIFVGKGVDTENYQFLSSSDALVQGKLLESADEITERKSQELLEEFEGMFDAFPLPGEKQKENVRSAWKSISPERKEIDSPPALDDVLLGQGLAETLGAKIGDTLTVVIATRSGALNALDVNVRGIIRGFTKEYNDTILKMPLKFAWKLMGEEHVSRIAMMLQKTENTDAVHTYLQDFLRQKNLMLETSLWIEEADIYKKVNALYHAIFGAISFIILLISIFSIGNTMLMSVMERVPEIGTLRSLGQTKAGILRLFLVEGFLIGLLGGILSILMGIAVSLFVNHVLQGIPMPPPPTGGTSYRAYLLVIDYPVVWAAAFNLSVVSSFLSTLWPSYKAANMEIVDCLRHS